MQNTEKRIILFTIFLILGIAISMQFRSILYANRQKAASQIAFSEYEKMLKYEKEKGKELSNEIKKYEEEKEIYLKDFANSMDADNLKVQLDDARLKAGLTDVKGQGVIVKLVDAPQNNKNNDNPSAFIIHDRDIVEVLNELKKAGAQALSVNGQRIIATSEQVCTGPTIRINKNRYSMPYEIKAIGDPDNMARMLENSEIVLLLREYEIKVEISKVKDLTIPKYNNKIQYLISGLEVDRSEE